MIFHETRLMYCNFVESHQERQIKIEEQVVFKMMTQMAEALVYLHAHNIIHRDLKTGFYLLCLFRCSTFHVFDSMTIK